MTEKKKQQRGSCSERWNFEPISIRKYTTAIEGNSNRMDGIPVK